MQQLEMSHEAQSSSFAETKGGIKLTGWLRYASILEENEKPITAGFSKFLKKHFHCEKCGGNFIFNVDEIQQHTEECWHQKQTYNSKEEIQEESPTSEQSTRNRFYCEKCDKTYFFTPLELLRHTSSHKS